jgi:hypothetical protein
MLECTHTKQITGFDREIAVKPYTSVFCPDCGQRIEENYVSRPFQLPHSQR